MKILYIGGNGNISWWCVNKSLALGHDVTVLTRGMTSRTRRKVPDAANILNIDINDVQKMAEWLGKYSYDVVCDFICFDEFDAKKRIELFAGKVFQYIFVSSVVVYQRKTNLLPFKEDASQWDITSYDYAKGKILAERYFMECYQDGFPITIVRPAHTYDTIVPVPLGHNCFTAPKRYLSGKPMLIPGDGTNLWTLCHSSDFAEAYCALVGMEDAIGEAFHITGDEWLTWLDIGAEILSALGVCDQEFVHVPLKEILTLNIAKGNNIAVTYFGDSYRGQRMWCDIYDNTKIKKFVPGWQPKIKFKEGIRKTFNWLMDDPVRMRFNEDLANLLEDLTIRYAENKY